MALVGKTNEEKIWNYFYGKIGNAFGCAGLIGNLFCESGLNPKNLQNTGNKKLGMTDSQYVAAVDNGTYMNFIKDSQGFGIAQWTFWTRKKALYEYAKSNNKSIGDLEVQLNFLYKELRESYKSVFNVLKKSTSVRQASDEVLLKFERPANQGISVQEKRASYGQTYYDKYYKNVQAVFVPYRVKVTTGSLNIRKGAGKNYKVVGQIKDKGIYTIIKEKNGQGASRWGLLKSIKGWISLDYTERF